MTSAEAKGGAASGAMAGWVGSVETTPLAEVLRRIAIEERSGDLQVSNPSATKTVYFDQGFVVFASSSLKNDRLGESMIEAGRISRREFALATELMEGGKRKFGQALVEAGIVSEEELGRHVAAQVNRIVLSLFSLRQGTYRFDERPCSIPLELMVSLSVYRILIDGIRRMRSKRLVITGLPPLDTKLRIVEAPPFTMDFYHLRSEERAVLRLVREGRTLREIASAIGGNEGVVLRACYALISAGVIEVVTPEAQSRPRRVQEETGTFMLSEIRRRVAKRPEEAQVTPTPTPEIEAGIEEIERRPEPVPPPRVSEIETPREVSVADTPEESVAIGWSLSRFASEAVEFVKVALLALVRRLFGREPKVPETSDGGRRPRRHVPVRARVPEKMPTVPRTRPEAQLAGRSSQEASEDQLVMEIIGIPSWSVKDDPGAPVDLSAELFKDESKEEPVDERLGVPKWSLMDDPNDHRTAPSMKFLEDEAAPETTGEELGSPVWSIWDRSDDREEEPDSPAKKDESSAPSREPLPEIELELDEPAVIEPQNQSLQSLDSDLFVEGDPGFDEQPSMLHHIPVEEISFEEDNDEEIEIEIEEESFTHLPEPAPEPPSPPVGESKPSRPNVSMPVEAPRPEGYSLSAVEEEKEEAAVSPAEQILRAKRLGLGEGGEDRLLRDIKLHFQHKDWEGAVRLLEDLVEISPGSAFYRGLLARAMSRHPVLRQNAEQHFIEALRLSPQDAQLHYWLGLYYKSYGLKARAVNEFRTTLRIDPMHKGARQQFAASGKRGDALGNVLKKFFS